MRYYLLSIFLGIIFFSNTNARELNVKASAFSDAKFSTGGNYKILINNTAEFVDIIEDCPKCKARYKKYKTKHGAAYAFGVIGVGAVVWPLGNALGSGVWEEDFTLILLGGIATVGISYLIDASAMSSLEEVAEAYNNQQKKSTSKLYDFKNDFAHEFGVKQFRVGYSFSF